MLHSAGRHVSPVLTVRCRDLPTPGGWTIRGSILRAEIEKPQNSIAAEN
jgi:hypothetical protein